jgi:hypothetical protein
MSHICHDIYCFSDSEHDCHEAFCDGPPELPLEDSKIPLMPPGDPICGHGPGRDDTLFKYGATGLFFFFLGAIWALTCLR